MLLQLLPAPQLFRTSAGAQTSRDVDVEKEALPSAGNVRWRDSVARDRRRLTDTNDRNDSDDSDDPYHNDSRILTSIGSPNIDDINEKAAHDSGPPSSRCRPYALSWKNIPAALFERSHTEENTPTFRVLPILSGIVVPFSILLAIPSLTGHWYIRTDIDNKVIEARPNPLLLDVAMITSMVCAVFASACLVIRFAERGVKPMTILCIIFLTIHDLISIISVTIFGVVHRFDDGFTYGQSFWMTVCATLASTITNVTLIIDLSRTPNFAKSGSGLTQKQRSLVVIVIVLLFYIALGSLIQAIMLKLTFIDALYLTVVSIETIGFGDIHPTSTATRIFTAIYTVFGILNLAVAVALTREALLEGVALTLQKRIRAIRHQDRERRIRTRWRGAIKWRLRAKGVPMWISDDQDGASPHRFLRRTKLDGALHFLRGIFGKGGNAHWRYTHGHRHKRLNIEGLTTSQLEAAAFEAGAPLSELLPPGLNEERDPEIDPAYRSSRRPPLDGGIQPLTHVRMGGMVSLLGKFALAVGHGDRGNLLGSLRDDTDDDEDDDDDDERSTPTTSHGVPLTRSYTMDDATLAQSVELEEKSAFYARLSAALIFFFVFWMAGSAIFTKTEGWTFGNAVYFCFIAFTTVGYGDFAPGTAAGRSIFVVWALLGVATMTILIAILSEAYSNRYKRVIHTEVYKATVGALPDLPTGRSRLFSDSQTIVGTMYSPGSPVSEPFSPPSGILKSDTNSSNVFKPSTLGTGGISLGQASTYSAADHHPYAPPSATSSNYPMLPLTANKHGKGRRRAFSSAVENNHVKSRRRRLEALPHHVLHHAETLHTLVAGANRRRGLSKGGVSNIPSKSGRRRSGGVIANVVEQLDSDSDTDEEEFRKVELLLKNIEASLQEIVSVTKDAMEDLDVVFIPPNEE